MALVKNAHKRIDDVDDLAYYNYFDTPKTQAVNDYCGNLARWQTYIPASQIYIGFYDQIAENPVAFLRGLFGFLDLEFDPGRYQAGQLTAILNPGIKKDIPPEFAHYLAKKYLPSLEDMYLVWPNPYVYSWLEYARSHAED